MSRVLVIDDDTWVRESLATLVERHGYAAQAAADGEEGLALHRTQPFDVVIADIVMPKKDGIETILELKSHTPKTAIIVISGGTGSRTTDFVHELEVLYDLGADRVLSKPFPRRILIECIDDVLAGRPRVRPRA